ncbi:MAG: rod shape-determining protein RodA [Ardenticatenaceae bacterium]|nr:rod shape-determining protein RodA [Anaerolineales bacterium]MCB8921144.1 rod shape-determining protein RodA [Ardenticatenaceae bacterium]MCB8990849.1 rod shape-determining protein RodA [Ardenticatenaceae bacterium]MCB9004457.1 rod shape-determining protein RodA [Ardenticatenaceae bacterium]
MTERTSVWRHFDIWLAAAVLLLTAYGILMIRSAVTGAPALEGHPLRQFYWAIAGIITMLIFAGIDYRYLASAHWYIYGVLVLSLILVVAAGQINNDARRWINLGFVEIQPSEFGRIFLTITFAQFLAQRRDRINQFSNTIATLIYLGLPVGLIFIQPDLGMSILFLVIWFVMIWLAGLPLSHFITLAVVGILAAGIVYPNLADYQKGRITSFVNPEDADPEDVFNVDQAVISVGTGGTWGKGYQQGTQSQLGFLRVQHTDFIFSVLTEEMGLVFGSLVVLTLMGFILWRILRVAAITPDPVGKLICTGIAAILFFQTVVSVGMNVRLLPVTGLTLPFVSYGGSSLITLFIAIGVVQSVLMRHRKQDFG